MEVDFQHCQSAHCENGVISNLLRHNNIHISEPMVFGIGSGLFYVYLPFIKINHAPTASFRTLPGVIFKRVASRLKIKIKRKKFTSKKKAMKALDKILETGQPVGLQVGAYHLSYFPPAYRFHFNAHNVVVYGKKDDQYLISDPVMEHPTSLTSEELVRVRFAKGAFAPNGHMYYPVSFQEEIDFKTAIEKGIKKTCREMLKIPIPITGVRGIRFFSKQVKKWLSKHGSKKAALYLGQMVRMQEEIGTGGGGFRFIYAAFLQEAGEFLKMKSLDDLSEEMTQAGDLWREFAITAARIYKKRCSADQQTFDQAADKLLAIADREEATFKKLAELRFD
jgi:hypothetical protein